LQLCQQLRADQRYQHLKIIAYTAHAMPEEVQLWESSGFDKVLLKPIRKDDLLALFK
jgi:CheY-like chemotaxis protein